jgi:hypothetical protein
VVVDAELNGTNKTTPWSERDGALKKEKKGQEIYEKDLTTLALLEMPGKR